MAHKIKMTFKTDGTVDLDVLEAKGKKCSDIAKPFMEAIGSSVKETKKPVYFVEETTHQSQSGTSQ